MKKMIGVEVGSYTFNAAAKTVAISGFSAISLEQILLITNVTRNTIIYNFADATKGATLSGTTLTLAFDTTSHSSSDRLQIFLTDTEDPSWFGLKDLSAYAKSILNAVVRPTFMDPTNGTVKVSGSLTTAGTISTVTTVTTVATVTSVTTLANQTNIGGFSAQLTELYDLTRATWASNVRARIT